MGDWPMKGPFDVIFCRNVLIYFDKPTKERLLQRFLKLLRPNGLLILGHSESVARDYSELEAVGQTTYRKL
jgi:chemotaxis protein methyltransferase CheR